MIKGNTKSLRVSIDKDTHDIYESLVSRTSKEAVDRPFVTMKDVFMTAACLGQAEKTYAPVKSKRGIFNGDVLREDDVIVLYALAFKKHKKIEALSDLAQVLEAVEGYANGGIHVLQDHMKGPGPRRLLRMIDLLSPAD
jgi:electron transfer flavoprotein alpha subunit